MTQTQAIRTNEPIVKLSNWAVCEIPLHGPNASWTRHLAGFAEDLSLAQVSSAIGTFDARNHIGTSASGHLFHLAGQAGRHAESSRMWVRWKRLNGLYEERDVTHSISKDLALSQGGIAT